ncbi:hypothetical protein ATANTOWER_020433 [Ataeniobius toweri]|uniref:Uncharacterized protein n=1 Tax=Ataeniobius toweri TaxID=208326 RepID=A0ABU7BTU0_9TELE|nr:hypothetical protein [Ataeniobius toweri]
MNYMHQACSLTACADLHPEQNLDASSSSQTSAEQRVPRGRLKSQEVQNTKHSKTSLMEAITMIPSMAEVQKGARPSDSWRYCRYCDGAEGFFLTSSLKRV